MCDTKSEGIPEIIHSYVCGPIPSTYLSGYVYYVTFIDDYSRKNWIYFLKSKDECLESSRNLNPWYRIFQKERSRHSGQIMEESILQMNLETSTKM